MRGVSVFAGVLSLAVMVRADADPYSYTGEPLIEDPVVAFQGEAGKSAGKRVRVASYNLEHFEDGLRDGDDRTREHAVQHARLASGIIAELDADILVIEELENAEALGILNGELADPYPLGYVTNLGTGQRRREKLNLGVLSRVPLEDVKEVDFGPLTGTGRPTRGLLRFTVDLGDDRKLLVYALHLKSNFGSSGRNIAQRKHALAILRADADQVMASSKETKWEVVAAGDFNVDPDLPDFVNDTSLQPLSDWVDLSKGLPLEQRVTIPTRRGDPKLEFPPAAFDRFIVTADLTQRPWKVERPIILTKGTDTTNVFTKPGEGGHVSDHFPLYLDIVR